MSKLCWPPQAAHCATADPATLVGESSLFTYLYFDELGNVFLCRSAASGPDAEKELVQARAKETETVAHKPIFPLV